MSWDGAWAAREHHEASLFDRANVVGIAIGSKVVGGRDTGEPCVTVYVERKLTESVMRRGDIVPKEVDGIRTDVVETGRFRALILLQRPEVNRVGRVRPAPGGVSIGHFRVTAGTLGVVARRLDGRPVILSNNHILANNNDARPGDPILQPAPADQGTPDDAIARLAEFVPLAFDDREPGRIGRFIERTFAPLLAAFGLGLRRLPSRRANFVDAAIAEPLAPDLVAREILEIGLVEGVALARIGDSVRKSGRTSGVTEGRIIGIDSVVRVDYNGRTALFRRQLVSDLPSKGGDSGSLVVDARRRAVGLLFAGSATTTLINPIEAVSRMLNITL